MRPLSYTQISMYQDCPLQYKLRYIEGLRPKDKWYFSFGSTLHQCAESFFRVKVPPPMSLEELLATYEKNWISKGYESAEDEAKYKDYGRQLLTAFWQIHYPSFKLPIAVERKFFIDIDGIKLTGFIDRVDKLDSGGLAIVDYKSGQSLFTKEDMEKNLQLTLYQMAVEETWQLPVEKLVLYHLRSNTPCSCLARPPAMIQDARNVVTAVAEGISSGDFPATENQFCPCDFAEHCPYYRHQYTREKSQPANVQLPLPLNVDETVERYVSLQGQVKELELEIEEVKQAIIEYCQAEGLNRVFGQHNAITYKMADRKDFNEADVKEMLEPEGLWPRVLGMDKTRLKELMEDENVPLDLRKRLEKLKRVVSSSPRLWVRRLGVEKD